MNMEIRYGLLLCCHAVYSTLVVMRNIWDFAKRLVEKWVYCDDIDREMCTVTKYVKDLKKVPGHIVVLLGNEDISFKDMANIVLWCMAAGITYITLYDHDGLLQEYEYRIYKVVKKRSKLHGKNIAWHKGAKGNSTYAQNGVQNEAGKGDNILLGTTPHGIPGNEQADAAAKEASVLPAAPTCAITLQLVMTIYYWEQQWLEVAGKKCIPKVQVKIMSYSDCEEAFLKVTKSLCLSTRNSEITVNDINQDLINEMLVEETGLPEPELAIYCGEVCCTYGFLPWHIRVTEFLKLRTHHNITPKEFIKLLETYGKCEQRFGK